VRSLWSVLLTKYCSGDKIEKNETGGHVARLGGKGEVHTVFGWGNLKGKGPIGRRRFRWEDNIKMDLQEVGCGGYGLDLAGSG